MSRYLFSSHDGFGLGHTRRNLLVARAILARDPDATVTLVTGVAVRPAWLGDDRLEVVSVPPMLKGRDGAYCNGEIGFDAALAQRAEIFEATVARVRPDVVVVDRHPYGIAGELLPGLERAARDGAARVLGLRDILDEPARVRAELSGAGWHRVSERFDLALVYGDRVLCDHVAEYGLAIEHEYCGWVVDAVAPRPRDPRLLVAAAGGGGDGDDVFELAVALTRDAPGWRCVLVAGPYASGRIEDVLRDSPELAGRVRVVRDAPEGARWSARAGAVLQMAGYNSTVEALAAEVRPILVPRRAPRREQAIRASRLAALNLADVVDEGAAPAEVAWLLARDRGAPRTAVEQAGIHLDGAARAATWLHRLAVLARAR